MKKEAESDSVKVETQKALRVKVAELLGWSDFGLRPVNLAFDEFVGWPPDARETTGKHLPVPNYPNDLNACAELIELLTAKGWRFCFLQFGERRVKWVASAQKLNVHHQVEASSLAAAICRAFIATMEAFSK